ncbi:MAG TPA: FGGY family carbohydrate kinase [Acidimicrobiales bacterium]|jgi:xylulokinase|nr:FGGY family carbohydrate kinase [Acidimicrobiales bacterium]
MASLLLGVDLGTTATKVVLCDESGASVATASLPVALRSDAAGLAEADTADWWSNVVALIPEVLRRGAARGADVAGVATTGMTPAVVCVGPDGPVRRAILQNDARAGAEIAELRTRLQGLDLLSLTGSVLSQQSVAPTLRWLDRHEPATWAATGSVVGSYDWLSQALGSEPHVEYNWAIESGMFDLDGSLLSPVLEAAGVDPGWLAPVRRSGDVVGTVSPQAASATGLVSGTPIVVGGADHVLSALVAGLAAPGDLLVKVGGAGDILVVAERAVVDERLYLDSHPITGRWLPNGCMATSGTLIRWLQALLGGTDLSSLDAQAAARRPAEVLCLPYFLGEKSPLHDPDLRGAFVGLHLGHDGATLHRAVLEAIAYGFRHHLEVFGEVGVRVGDARVTNGGSRSTLWKQILADVLGIPLTPVVDHPGAGLGAALAAGVGTGVVGGWEAAGGNIRRGATVVPRSEVAAVYGDAYATWRQLGATLAPVSNALSARARA